MSSENELSLSDMKLNGVKRTEAQVIDNISHNQKQHEYKQHHHKSTGRSIDRDDLGIYFKQLDSDTNKVKCLLCSTLLCNNSGSSFSSLLSDHLKLKHAIDKEELGKNGEQQEQRRRKKQQQQQYQQDTNSVKRVSSNDSNYQKLSKTSNPKARNEIANMTNHKHQRFKSADQSNNRRAANSTNLNSSNNINNLRRNLDLFEYEDFSKASLKPLPSSSLSKNLFSRLNQLSSPVTRKLKFWNKKSFEVNQYDPCFKVIYLGNLGMQFWSKDEICLDKPLNTLWNNYLVNMKTEIVMRLTICNSGLKAITRQHGLTQYWSNRLVYCCSHKNYPKIFSWIYRHEGKKMRQELRCHAVFCSSAERAAKMVTLLNQRLACALQEFRREKKSRGLPSIASSLGRDSATNDGLMSSLMQQTLPRTVPLRRQILAKGSANFRPPLERSKSAPKLMSIREEDYELEEEDEEEDNDYEQDQSEDDLSHDEFEYEQSFGDKDDDDSDYDEDELGWGRDIDGDEDSTHKVESNSLTTVNEETSNSSVYATGDISYDNIIMNRQNLSVNQDRLECASTMTAPAGILSTSRGSSERATQRESSSFTNETPAMGHEHISNHHERGDDNSHIATKTTNCHVKRGESRNSSANNNIKIMQQDISSSNKIVISSDERNAIDQSPSLNDSVDEVGNSDNIRANSVASVRSIEIPLDDDNIPSSTTSTPQPSKIEHEFNTNETSSITHRSGIAPTKDRSTPDDDSATEDIILSWSNNLLIK